MDAAAEVLAAGGIVLLVTDTLPGLHCRADCQAAVERLATIKRRPATKPFLVLCSSVAEALQLAADPAPQAVAYLQRCWPGPFTFVLPAGPAAPPVVTAGTGTIAVRVPRMVGLTELVAKAGFPLVSTSANLPGLEPLADLAEAGALFGPAIDGLLIVSGPRTGAPSTDQPGRASALVDLCRWPPGLLREGPEPPPAWDDLGPPA